MGNLFSSELDKYYDLIVSRLPNDDGAMASRKHLNRPDVREQYMSHCKRLCDMHGEATMQGDIKSSLGVIFVEITMIFKDCGYVLNFWPCGQVAVNKIDHE